MKLPRKELRDTSISLRLSQTEREHLARLTEHYKTSNADLIAWLLAKEIQGLEETMAAESESGKGPTLEQLAERIAILERAIGKQ